MGWQDKATEIQINALFYMMNYRVNSKKQMDATHFAEENFNRKQVSDELRRWRKLAVKKLLTEDACFDSPIWEEFKRKYE